MHMYSWKREFYGVKNILGLFAHRLAYFNVKQDVLFIYVYRKTLTEKEWNNEIYSVRWTKNWNTSR